jgi:hypothetical protein
MRPIMKTTMCALVAAAMAAPAPAASSGTYLTFGPVTGAQADARKGHDKWIEVQSWSWGATDTAVPGNGSPERSRRVEGGTSNTAKFGAVAGAHRDDSLARAAEPALAAPLDRGSVRVKVKFPWLDCRVGAAFPDAVLHNDAGRYEFKDALISGCAPDSVTLDYAKVQVRGWDPAKK